MLRWWRRRLWRRFFRGFFKCSDCHNFQAVAAVAEVDAEAVAP